MKLGKIVFIFCLVLFLGACGDKSETSEISNTPATSTKVEDGKIVITGAIEKSEGIQMFLDRLELTGGNVIVDRKVLESDGSFSFEVERQPTIYRLRLGSKNIFLPLSGKETVVQVNGNLGLIDQYIYDINGSKESKVYRQTLEGFIKQQPTEKDIATLVDTTTCPMAAALVMMQALDMSRFQFNNPEEILAIHKNANTKLIAAFPNTRYVQEYSAYIGGIQQLLSQQRIKVGAIPPDIELPNPDGSKSYRLSDLRGKVVLLDFWASWCKPCRMNNPEVVRIYNKYKSKGFTVYSVSLDGVDPRLVNSLNAEQLKSQEDRARERWVNAIQQDNLTWKYHVSDLQFWQCAPAKEYGVSSIPRTFLLDKEGRITAINPRGPQLERAIQELL